MPGRTNPTTGCHISWHSVGGFYRRPEIIEAPQLGSARAVSNYRTPMLKTVVGLVTVLFVAGSAYAQEASHARLSPTEMNILTDARIGMTKAALQLTPEQQK